MSATTGGRNVLGPERFGCGHCICDGCMVEGNEALRIANEALGFVVAGKRP